MPTLTIDDTFTGFTFEQEISIGKSAHHWGLPRNKKKNRMPTCVMGGERFVITRVKSSGLRHSVRRMDGKWIVINGPTTVEWTDKGTPPPGTPTISAAPTVEVSNDDMKQRLLNAMQCIGAAKSFVDKAAQELWGIGKLSHERESILKLYYSTDSTWSRLSRLRNEEGLAAKILDGVDQPVLD